MFGIILEKHIGSLKFLTIYLISGMIGNSLQSMLYPNSFVLGASASLFGLLGAIILTDPLLELKIFGIIKTPIILLFGAFFAINALIENYFLNFGFNLVSADLAHLIGFMCGILITGIFYDDRISIFYNWLLIFAGFWLIEYAIKNIISNPNIISVLILQIIFISIGFFAIIYSYKLLKMKLLSNFEE